MSIEKKSARPVGGTTERSRQEKQQTSGNSRQNHTTQGLGGQWKISDLLSCGRENAISCRELERLTGLDGRKVAPILADNTTGYIYPPQSTNGPPVSAPCATGRQKSCERRRPSRGRRCNVWQSTSKS